MQRHEDKPNEVTYSRNVWINCYVKARATSLKGIKREIFSNRIRICFKSA